MMKLLSSLYSVILTFVLLTIAIPVGADTWDSVGIDSNQNVFAIRGDGTKIFLTSKGHCENPKLSDDQQTIAWMRTKRIENLGQNVVVSSRLIWLRNAKVHTYATEVFIRGFWFVDGGKKIGINTGGLHFAGMNELLDADTGKLLDTFEDRYRNEKKVPSWAEF
jgi:hypothetical protein